MVSLTNLIKRQYSRNVSISRNFEVKNVKEREIDIAIEWKDGTKHIFTKKWLRDNCQCDICHHPESKQRMVNTYLINSHPTISTIKNQNNKIHLNWNEPVTSFSSEKNCYNSVFTSSFLRSNIKSIKRQQTVHSKTLWDNKYKIINKSTVSYNDFMESESEFYSAMSNLYKTGLLLIENTPLEMKKTEKLARKIGFVMETIYGKMWTTKPIKPEEMYNDTASTNYALPVHTDCTYLINPPALQIFNCVKQVTEKGKGESLFMDGFMVGEILKNEKKEYYNYLLNKKIIFQHIDKINNIHLETCESIFKEDCLNQLIQFRFNNTDRGTDLNLQNNTNKEEEIYFYEAYHYILNIMNNNKKYNLLLKKKLNPGQLMIVDNHRIMHGRNSFNGKRELIGCYICIDEYNKKLRELSII